MSTSIKAKNSKNKKAGFSVVELLVAVSIITVFVFSVSYSYSLILRLALQNTQSIKAVFLAEEGVEAIKYLKSSDWQNNISILDSGTNYYLEYSLNNWIVTDNNIFIDELFERKFILEDVNRDENGHIVLSPQGEIDDGTKKLTVYISWQNKSLATSTKSISTYISDY